VSPSFNYNSTTHVAHRRENYRLLWIGELFFDFFLFFSFFFFFFVSTFSNIWYPSEILARDLTYACKSFHAFYYTDTTARAYVNARACKPCCCCCCRSIVAITSPLMALHNVICGTARSCPLSFALPSFAPHARMKKRRVFHATVS